MSEREQPLIGLAVTMACGCQVCTRNRLKKDRSIGLTDDELNALIAVASAVNSGVTAATARVAFGMVGNENAAAKRESKTPASDRRTEKGRGGTRREKDARHSLRLNEAFRRAITDKVTYYR